jgi:pimeloyl-ACP methyl ester carboxylesterase
VLREDQAARATEALYRAFLLHDAPSMARRPRDERLYVPTRLLFGGREPLGTALAQGLEDHADDAQVELLDGCGHWVPEERPQVVAERIRAMAA